MEADRILATHPRDALSLFESMGGLVAGFHKLAREWHPDVNKTPRADEVFRHVVTLRRAAEGRSGKPADATRTFASADGKSFELRHLRSRPTEVGEFFVGRSSVTFLVGPDHLDLAEAAARTRPRFADAGMKAEMEKFLPRPVADQETVEGRVMGFTRTPDQIPLADLVEHVGGRLDAVHAAWLASGLMNLCCWLEWAGVSNGWMAPDTILVSPLHHSVALTGPFLFSTPLGRRPEALPERTLSIVPRLGVPGTVADATLDLELARAAVREALGDPGGARSLGGGLPAPFALWLTTPPAATAKADYAAWERAREASFGKRRFVELKVSEADVYGG